MRATGCKASVIVVIVVVVVVAAGIAAALVLLLLRAMGAGNRRRVTGWLAWWWVVLRHGHDAAPRVGFPLPPPPSALVWVGDVRRATRDGAGGGGLRGAAMRPRLRASHSGF